MKTLWIWLLLLVGSVALFALVPTGSRESSRPEPVAHVEPQLAQGYAGRMACAKCHREEAEQWATSPHGRHATPRAEPLGGADLAVGSVWMQAYLRRDSQGYHRILPQCFDLRTQEWRPVTQVLDAIGGPSPDRPSVSDAVVAGRDFDTQCAGCHSSGATAVIDLSSGRLSSGWRDAAIDCEACHGPGLAHANSWRALDSQPVAMARLEALPPADSTALCARCHGGPPAMGDYQVQDAAHFIGSLRTDSVQTADGTSLGQGYQYGAFSRSPCVTRGGLTCAHCHQAHGPGLRPMADADALCARCHQEQAGTAHHHHPIQSEGARCIACHMPQLLDGVMAHQRDHRIGSPLPHSSAVRDACTTCHADKDKAWARGAYEQFWGPPPGSTLRAVEAIAAADAVPGASRQALLEAQLHSDPWFRARAGELLDDLERLLADPVAEVRLHGLHMAAHRADPSGLLQRAAEDVHPRIRGQAIALLNESGTATSLPTPEQAADIEVFVRQQRASSGARIVLARVAMAQQRWDEAIQHLTVALGMQPERADGWRLLGAAYEANHEMDRSVLAYSRWAESFARAVAQGRLSIQDFERVVGGEVESGRTHMARLILDFALQRLPPGNLRGQVERMHTRLRGSR